LELDTWRHLHIGRQRVSVGTRRHRGAAAVLEALALEQPAHVLLAELDLADA